MGARGNSGVIVSQLLRGLAATLAPSDDEGAEPMIDADLIAQGLGRRERGSRWCSNASGRGHHLERGACLGPRRSAGHRHQ